MSRSASPKHNPNSPRYEDASMHPEFSQESAHAHLKHMFSAISNILLQVNHTHQSLIGFLSAQQTQAKHTDSKVRPRPFSGLPSEDVLTWLDHFENVAGYHNWDNECRAHELRTVLEGVAAAWFVQQGENVKHSWSLLKQLLLQSFAHQNVTQTALQQLNSLRQQHTEPVAHFAVKLNQLFLCADPSMSEEMKLYFLWPCLQHDISRRVCDQGPLSFHEAIQIAQRLEGSMNSDLPAPIPPLPQGLISASPPAPTHPTPMDIDVQNVQNTSRRALPARDAQGRPKCFYCNMYEHVRRHCRRLQARQVQNTQIQVSDAATLAALPENF
ncbi:hypothetical protein GOP47_0017120 [Adiantum capillus-veneris]|uniref:Ty3 transposon capsid-like protein domain-containing protein n=1 Tax=Adiantum capillus-veneris TaxID=13818 RepID=A0A9D4UJ31_ADICA|nr:hypothetical protein GOP47_0017120 [Adiantum capillus-veneris]